MTKDTCRSSTLGRALQAILSWTIGAISLAVLASPASATWTILADHQVRQMHEAVCDTPVQMDKEGGKTYWNCRNPRGYRDENECSLSFNKFSQGGAIRVWFGRFTAPWDQAVAMYYATCESHANGYGGAVLFNMNGDKFVLDRFFPGRTKGDCAVQPRSDRFQSLFCYYSGIGQGALEEDFGPMILHADGTATEENWLSAGNIDGLIGASVSCDHRKAIHHFFEVRSVGSAIEVYGAYVNPSSAERACARFHQGIFDSQENEMRDTSVNAQDKAFLREGERKYLKIITRFNLPDRAPIFQFTPLSVPPSDPRYYDR